MEVEDVRRFIHIAIALLSPLALVSQAGATRVAIHPLQALGTEHEIADRLDATFRAEAARIPGVEMVPRAEVEAAIADLEEAPGECAKRPSCLASIGRATKAHSLVFGTVASLGQSYVLDVKLINVRQKKEVRRKVKTLSGARAVLIEGVRDVAVSLIAPKHYVGSIEVRGDAPGGQLFIDNNAAGAITTAAIGGIEPGAHLVRVTREGFDDLQLKVPVRLGRTTLVNVTAVGGTLEATVVEREDPAPPAPTAERGSSLMPAAVALGLLGGGLTLFGAGSLAIWVRGYSAAGDVLSDEGLVTDPEAYEAWERDRTLYEGLGIAGSITLPLGILSLAGGGLIAALTLLDAPEEE